MAKSLLTGFGFSSNSCLFKVWARWGSNEEALNDYGARKSTHCAILGFWLTAHPRSAPADSANASAKELLRSRLSAGSALRPSNKISVDINSIIQFRNGYFI